MAELNLKLLPGLPALITIIFVIAKIMDKFDYSWWIVFSPLWISAIITIITLLIILVIIRVWIYSD